MSKNNELLNQVVQIAEDAASVIMDIYETDFTVEHKDDNTPVTSADYAANNTIQEALQSLTPNIPFLSEESADIPFEIRKKWQTYWLVDPLDGTQQFINRNGEFTVNIALIENHKPVLGVIHVPATNVYYFASEGQGAFKHAEGITQRIGVKPASKECLRVATSQRAQACNSLNQFLSKLANYSTMTLGSSLKSCLVAEGKADVYPKLGPTSEWDTAAAQILLEEAGGHVIDTHCSPLRYNTKDSLLNPHFIAFGDHSIDWTRFL